MRNYKSYPTYKDSEVSCLGTIPEHWENQVLKYVFSENKEKNIGGIEEHILSLSYGNVISKKEKENYGLLPDSFDTYQIINPEYLIFRFTDLQNDHKSLRVGYADMRGIITSAYLGLKKRNEKVHTKYFYYLFHSLDTQKYFYGFGGGVRLSLSWDILSKIKYPIPPKEEQTAIANFLDKKTAQIKQFIALKEKTIALLKERKTAIINQAVTKGLDPKVKMKDSGIEWLGEIPEHWEVTKTRYLLKIIGGYAFSSSDFKDQGIQLLKIANLYGNRLALERQPTFLDKTNLKKNKQWVVKKGDILMSLTGTLGKRDYGFAILIDSDELYFLNQRVAKVNTTSKITTEYALFLLRSEMFLDQLYRKPAGTKQANLSNDDVLNCYVSLPPEEEWQHIIEFATRKSAEIDESITQAEKEIALMKEYQQSLISEAVTGKIDVREEVLVS